MPTYDYQCRACGTIHEVIHSMLEEGPASCERCGGELRRVFYPTGIIFKGSGFYQTDSRTSSSKSVTGDAPSKTADTAASSSDGAKSTDSGPAAPKPTPS